MALYDTFFLETPSGCFIAYSAILTSSRGGNGHFALNLVDGGQLFVGPDAHEASFGLVSLGTIGLNPLFVPQRSPAKCWTQPQDLNQGTLNLVNPAQKTTIRLIPPDQIERSIQTSATLTDVCASFESLLSGQNTLSGHTDLLSRSSTKRGIPSNIPPSFVVAVQPEHPTLFVPFTQLSHVTPMHRGFGLHLADGSLLRLKDFPTHLGLVELKGKDGTRIGLNPVAKTEIVTCAEGVQTEIRIPGPTLRYLRVDETADAVRKKSRQANRQTCRLVGFDARGMNGPATVTTLHAGLRGALVPASLG